MKKEKVFKSKLVETKKKREMISEPKIFYFKMAIKKFRH